MRTENKYFKLKGLNKKGKTGVYATVDIGNEDWFHSDFDETLFPIDRQYALFNMFKDTEENLWSGQNHIVLVYHEGYSTGGVPINPIIKELLLDI